MVDYVDKLLSVTLTRTLSELTDKSFSSSLCCIQLFSLLNNCIVLETDFYNNMPKSPAYVLTPKLPDVLGANIKPEHSITCMNIKLSMKSILPIMNMTNLACHSPPVTAGLKHAQCRIS